MTPFSVLVDLANTPVFRGMHRPNREVVGARIDDFIERVRVSLSAVRPGPVAHYEFRFYDGWFDESCSPASVQPMVVRHLAENYPTRLRGDRVKAGIAEGPLDCLGVRLPHTYRVTAGLPRVSLEFRDEMPFDCPGGSECLLPALRVWLKSGRCPRHEETCTIRLGEVVSHRHQKLIDTLLVADLMSLALDGTRVAVVSDDEDVIPGLLAAARRGAAIYWLCRNGAPRAPYRSVFAGSGVECVEC